MLTDTSSSGDARSSFPWLKLLVVGGVLAAIVAVIGVGGSMALDGDEPLSDQEQAADVAQRFVAALGAGDIDAVYELQTVAYQNACPRSAFRDAFPRLNILPLEGPATVTISGDTAGASMFEVQPDGSRQRVVMPLMRENGKWRLGPPSLTGCLPEPAA